MMKHKHSRGCCLLVLVALSQNLHAREVMSWVPPYAIETCKTVLDSNFGAFSPSNGLTRLGLQFWIPTASGGVVRTTEYGAIPDSDVIWFKNWGRVNGTEVLLCLFNNVDGLWDWNLAVSAFRDNRSNFVANLVATVKTYNLDGVDIDLEGPVTPTPGDRLAFKQFLEALSAELKPLGKTLTVDSFHTPLYNAPNMSWWTDWTDLVDNVHVMGYNDLYEGSTQTVYGLEGYPFRYSWQQNYGVDEAGLAAEVISMGLPGWTANWGSGGRGNNVLDHIRECIYDCSVPPSVCIWDIQLLGDSGTPGWRSSEVWEILAKLSQFESMPSDKDGDDMADEWEIGHFGGTNEVDGGHWEDKDGDRYSNLEEYVAGTNPTNGASLWFAGIQRDASGNVVVSYPAQSPDVFDVNYGILERCYWLENTSNLLNAAWNPVPGSTNIVRNVGRISYTNAMPAKADFYRVGVSLR